MSGPSLSEIAKVPAGSALKDLRGACKQNPCVRAMRRCRRERPKSTGIALAVPESRRETSYTFFERRTGTNNQGTLEHAVDLIHGGLPVTRQEAPGFPQVREMMFVITESKQSKPLQPG